LRVDLLRIFLSHLDFLLLRNAAPNERAGNHNANYRSLHSYSREGNPIEMRGKSYSS